MLRKNLTALGGVLIRVLDKAPSVDVNDEALIARSAQQIKAEDKLVKSGSGFAADFQLWSGQNDRSANFTAVGIAINDAINVGSLACLSVEKVADGIDLDICAFRRLIELFVDVTACCTHLYLCRMEPRALVFSLAKELADATSLVVDVNV